MGRRDSGAFKRFMRNKEEQLLLINTSIVVARLINASAWGEAVFQLIRKETCPFFITPFFSLLGFNTFSLYNFCDG